MVSLKLTALIIAGLLCVGSLSAVAQSIGNDAPVDKGGMPPSTEMNANSADGDELPSGSINGGNGGNGGNANGSSTSSGKGSAAVSGGSSMGDGGAGKTGSAGDASAGDADEKGG